MVNCIIGIIICLLLLIIAIIAKRTYKSYRSVEKEMLTSIEDSLNPWKDE